MHVLRVSAQCYMCKTQECTLGFFMPSHLTVGFPASSPAVSHLLLPPPTVHISGPTTSMESGIVDRARRHILHWWKAFTTILYSLRKRTLHPFKKYIC